MLNPDEVMDSIDLYHPDFKPLTQDDMNELSAMFAYLFEEECQAQAA